MDFQLSQEQRAFQDLARDFAAAEMAPHAGRWDEEKIFPEEILAPGGRPGLRRHHLRS